MSELVGEEPYPFEFPVNHPTDPVCRAVDGGLQVTVGDLDDERSAPTADLDDDLAPLVDPASWTVDVGQSDCDPINQFAKAPECKPHPSFDTILHQGFEFHAL